MTFPEPRAFLATSGGLLLFPADDGTHGAELWASDGTEAGTILMQDIDPGADGRISRAPADRARGGRLFLGQHPGGRRTSCGGPRHAGRDLARQGHRPGKLSLRRRRTSPSSPAASFSRASTESSAPGCGHPTGPRPGQCWSRRSRRPRRWLHRGRRTAPLFRDRRSRVRTRSGRATEPRPARCWSPISADRHSPHSSRPFSLVETSWRSNGRLYFRAYDTDGEIDLWASDGTAAGTVLVAEATSLTSSITVSPRDGRVLEPTSWGALGSRLIYLADNGTSGNEPWVSDGTAASTQQLAETVPGADWSYFYGLTPLGSSALFSDSPAPSGRPTARAPARPPCLPRADRRT